jgi:hypothetical protein
MEWASRQRSQILKEFSENFGLALDIGSQPTCTRMNAVGCFYDPEEGFQIKPETLESFAPLLKPEP